MMRVPPLATERLMIRPFTMDDLDAIHQMLDIDLMTADFGTEGANTRQEREYWLQWTILSYEEFAADPVGCLRARICPLLGVPAAAPQTKLRKQNTLPLKDRITNYHEVAALISSPLCRQDYGGHAGRRAAG